jgi:hypothetical protein
MISFGIDNPQAVNGYRGTPLASAKSRKRFAIARASNGIPSPHSTVGAKAGSEHHEDLLMGRRKVVNGRSFW